MRAALRGRLSFFPAQVSPFPKGWIPDHHAPGVMSGMTEIITLHNPALNALTAFTGTVLPPPDSSFPLCTSVSSVVNKHLPLLQKSFSPHLN